MKTFKEIRKEIVEGTDESKFNSIIKKLKSSGFEEYKPGTENNKGYRDKTGTKMKVKDLIPVVRKAGFKEGKQKGTKMFHGTYAWTFTMDATYATMIVEIVSEDNEMVSRVNLRTRREYD